MNMIHHLPKDIFSIPSLLEPISLFHHHHSSICSSCFNSMLLLMVKISDSWKKKKTKRKAFYVLKENPRIITIFNFLRFHKLSWCFFFVLFLFFRAPTTESLQQLAFFTAWLLLCDFQTTCLIPASIWLYCVYSSHSKSLVRIINDKHLFHKYIFVFKYINLKSKGENVRIIFILYTYLACNH